MANLRLLCAVTVLLAICSIHNVEGLLPGFHENTCFGAEFEIARLVNEAIHENAAVAPQFIRLLFHDCAVQGCDASILLDSANGTAEKDGIPNSFFFIFDLIDQIKAAIEELCPGVVSCADILAYSARTSLLAVGGPFIDIGGGRYDGFISLASEANQDIPSPFSTLSELITIFTQNLELSIEDLVVLSGAHTVGVGHCGAFSSRLRPTVDPTLNPAYAAVLSQECPVNFPTTDFVSMDPISPGFFDNGYFRDVVGGEGLFDSDAALYTAGSPTKGLVDQFASNPFSFYSKFGPALKRLAAVGVKTPPNGNIRANCRSTAPA